MKAAAIDRFGGADQIKTQIVPVPEIASDEVLIKVEYAGVGSWEPFEREGGYAEMLGITPSFPYILGSEGSGTIVGVGKEVDRFKLGDKVYAAGFLNPKGGFYAEYVAIPADLVSNIPSQLTIQEAAAMPGASLTALRGLDDTLQLKKDETIMIFGASGAMGHLAVQLAKRMGAEVFAVASGIEGAKLAKEVGADVVVDGHSDDVDVVESVMECAPNRLDAIFLTAGGEVAEASLKALRKDGRVAYPTGIYPEPKKDEHTDIRNFNGEPDRDLIERFSNLIGTDPFKVYISQTFTLDEASEAHRVLEKHHNGKILLHITQ